MWKMCVTESRLWHDRRRTNCIFQTDPHICRTCCEWRHEQSLKQQRLRTMKSSSQSRRYFYTNPSIDNYDDQVSANDNEIEVSATRERDTCVLLTRRQKSMLRIRAVLGRAARVPGRAWKRGLSGCLIAHALSHWPCCFCPHLVSVTVSWNGISIVFLYNGTHWVAVTGIYLGLQDCTEICVKLACRVLHRIIKWFSR